MRLAIVGIGGVGGLLAGPLIRKYRNEVTLIARGKRKEHLEAEGLRLSSQVFGTFAVQPALVTDRPEDLPSQDIVLVCVKNGDLPAVIPELLPLTGDDTVVIPVMNGVTAGEKLRTSLPRGIVCGSVIYTVSGTDPEYTVVQKGAFTQLFIGSLEKGRKEDDEAVSRTCEILREAGIDCTYRENVFPDIWRKFILNCAFNVVTAAHGATTGEIALHEQWKKDYRTLLQEAWTVGRAEGVDLADSVPDDLFRLFSRYDPGSKSSLSRDFEKHRVGEKDIFSRVVVEKAHTYGVPVPVTETYARLLDEVPAGWEQAGT